MNSLLFFHECSAASAHLRVEVLGISYESTDSGNRRSFHSCYFESHLLSKLTRLDPRKHFIDSVDHELRIIDSLSTIELEMSLFLGSSTEDGESESSADA